jgi:hypothetical protein
VTKIVVLAPNLSPRLRVKGALQSASSRRLAQFDHSDVCGRVEAKEARRWIEVEFDVRKRDLGHIAEYEKDRCLEQISSLGIHEYVELFVGAGIARSQSQLGAVFFAAERRNFEIPLELSFAQ